ncbi:uncharacterized protein MKZ38_008181 [Zalerion maritima]|uniref:Uncharacterized protein n=1 Tax=Zalerion maritima TaxID=339359 RepID=A0AAD5RV68_9PEZI|nr:uncharacterized protein MKZ38_008181 [Zalerion maritima]
MGKMGLWLFHRKSHKRSRSGANLSDPEVNAAQSQGPQQSQTPDVQSKPKRQRTNGEPNKLRRRRNRDLSYSPGRQDLIQVSRQRRKSREFPALPHPQQSSHQQRSYYPPQAHPLRHTPQPPSGSDSHNGSQEWFRYPTLRKQPVSSAQMKRTKSSKRRRVDRNREAEIRKMSSHIEPLRPATEQWMSGRPSRRDSRRIRGGFFSPSSEVSLPSAASIRSSISTDSERAAFRVLATNTLAPRPTLRYSSRHGYPRHHEYDPFAYGGDATREGLGLLRSRSQSKKLVEHPPIPEATLRAHKRIDDLADDLTASDIRELMERDMRRRERKKQRDQERMERRLSRQVQKEQLQREQAEREQTGGPSLERGVIGRELAGMGVTQPPSAILTSSRLRASDGDKPMRMDVDDEAASPPSNRESTSSSQPRPLEQFHRAESIHINEDHDKYMTQDESMLPTPPRELNEPTTEHSDIIYEEEEPSPAVAAAIAAASGFPERKASINRRKSDRRVLTKKSRSRSPPLTHETQGVTSPIRQDDTSTTHKSSETGGSGRASRMSWTAIFKWPVRKKRSSAGPSSFSNTSRDSMQAAYIAYTAAAAVASSASAASSSVPQPGSVPIAPNITFIPPRRDGTPSVPRRTVSRFREDLPETTISPPRSGIQSPTANSPPSMPVAGEELDPEYYSGEPTPTQDTHTPRREVDIATPTSMQTIQMSSVDPSPEPQSMSLASLDSEGSWFGGGMGAGRKKRARLSSLNQYQQPEQQQEQREEAVSSASNANNTEDDLGLSEDEYFTRLSPPRGQALRVSTGEARPSSDGGNPGDGEATGEATWGTLPRTPTVHHEAHRMKSSEGLLNSYGDVNDVDSEEDKEMRVDNEKEDSGIDTDPESPESPERGEEPAGLQRATSINLGRSHVRHISAGSAKLLELTPRASVEGKRRSYEPPASITQ